MLHIKCTHTYKQRPCQRKKENYKKLSISLLLLGLCLIKKMIKMIKKLLLVSCLLITIGCAEKSIEKCNLLTQSGITTVDGKIFTGSCHIIHSDTLITQTLTFKRGKISKQVNYYVPSGEIEYIGHWKNGKIHGDFESYYENGIMSIDGQLIEGQYDGEWTYWDDDGTMNKELTYDMGTVIDSTYYKN